MSAPRYVLQFLTAVFHLFSIRTKSRYHVCVLSIRCHPCLAAEAIIPVAERPQKKRITEATLKLVKKKREIKQQRQQTKQKEEEYRWLRDEVKKAARNDKEEWLQGRCRMLERCMGENRTIETYKPIKQLNRKWTSTQRMIKDKNGKIIQVGEETKKRWTEYCSGLYSNNENNKELVDELHRIAPIQNEEDTEEEDDILYEEVEKAENQLKQNKSTETDEITGEMIQAGRERMTEEINKLCWQARGG